MVLFFTSNVVEPPVTIYMGRDKEENEDLIKYAWPEDVWFHVDKLSSAHVYLRLPPSIPSWENIPQALDRLCSVGNKKNNLQIVYTPASNLKKTGDMAVGQVSFHRNEKVKRVHVAARENPIVNRLNKTKVEREVDHEAEKAERLRQEAASRRQEAAAKRKAELELAKKREEEKKARSYDHAWASAEPSTSKSAAADEDEDFWGENAKTDNIDDSRMKEFEDFM
ncbi:Coiled-coil domain-containing protein 25 [Serendipita indica DSM 11827]|nr:Coiled-coil domain-containing protein 25 [Serendipita indica DSM 11827]